MFDFYHTCLNSFNIFSLCSGGTIISSVYVVFASGSGFGFTILLAILFPKYYPIA